MSKKIEEYKQKLEALNKEYNVHLLVDINNDGDRWYPHYEITLEAISNDHKDNSSVRIYCEVSYNVNSAINNSRD